MTSAANGRLVALVMLMLMLLLPLPTSSAVNIAENQSDEVDVRAHLPDHWEWAYDSQGPVCGVYSVCRALGQLGIEVEPKSLWNTRVVGQKQGSTPGELIAVIEQFGCHADLRQHMSLLELQATGEPVIANVRGAPDRSIYDHWVCVQAGERGLILFDGSGSSRIIEPGEFLASFSGVGIVVSRTRDAWYWNTAARLLGIGSLLAVGWFGLAAGGTPGSTVRQQLSRIAGVTVALVVTGWMVFGTADGFVNGNKLAVAPFVGVDYRDGGMADLLKAIESPTMLLVDARQPDSVAYGTLKRAVNIPVYADYYEIRDFTRDLPRDTPIVVFCQSERCGYDEHIAAVLSRLGFSDITTSKQGFVEFIELNTEQETHTTERPASFASAARQ